jgi:hypothetical protein
MEYKHYHEQYDNNNNIIIASRAYFLQRLVVCFLEIDRVLGFSRRGEYIGERVMSGGGLGGHTTWWRGPGVGRVTLWCGCLLAPLRLCFGLCLMSEKIGTLAFVSSNSENISCVAFFKHKNSRKQGTGTVASR